MYAEVEYPVDTLSRWAGRCSVDVVSETVAGKVIETPGDFVTVQCARCRKDSRIPRVAVRAPDRCPLCGFYRSGRREHRLVSGRWPWTIADEWYDPETGEVLERGPLGRLTDAAPPPVRWWWRFTDWVRWKWQEARVR